MIRSTPYTTRIQFAVPPDLITDFHKLFRKQAGFEVLKENIAIGNELLQAVQQTHPDVLLLDMTLPDLDAEHVLSTLSSTRIPRYVVATAPRYEPHLCEIQRFKAVKAALPRILAVSPVLRQVIAGVAEGSNYFVPSPPVEQSRSGLTKDETILLALMAVGLDSNELVQELGRSINVIYTSQSFLRKKLNVGTNEQAILAGIRNRMVAVFTDSSERAA